MQAQVGVVVAVAILHDDVVTDLPTDTVAIVVASLDAPHRHPITVLQKDAAGIIAVEVIVLFAVTVQRDIFDHAVADKFAAD